MQKFVRDHFLNSVQTRFVGGFGVFVIYIVALSFVKQSAAVVAVLPPMLSRPC
jgi:hypothetical protein